MARLSQSRNIFTIPPGTGFAKALARQILHEVQHKPETLPDWRIFLPTRRACRVLQDAFLEQSGGRSLLLPRLLTLGDVEDDALMLDLAIADAPDESLNLPPALSALRRRMLLARLVQAQNTPMQAAHALKLADALAHLMDQIYTEGLDLADLLQLAPPELAQHWQITLDFLKILSSHWPTILAEHNVMDAADRRNRLMRALAAHWKNQPPQTPIIAAGTTGTIPATALLLQTIAALPQGRIVLPGLDQDMEEADWEALEEGHPQAGLKHLLQTLDVQRADVALWPGVSAPAPARVALIREVMRPAKANHSWAKISVSQIGLFQEGLAHVQLAVCAHAREEAEIIALSLRTVLETPGKTATLITPDRTLARRVALACRRWGIVLNDSAGLSLAETAPGVFFLLLAQAVAQRFSPVALLALLKHPLCSAVPQDYVYALEHILRGPRPRPGLEELGAHIEKHLSAGDEKCTQARGAWEVIAPIMRQITSCIDSGKRLNIKDFLVAHVGAAQALSTENALWADTAGEALSQTLAELISDSSDLVSISAHEFPEFLKAIFRGVVVRPPSDTHPRLNILGQLEARLIDSDYVILAGLNEGTWPPEPGHDPWMSRSMRSRFGLPPPERALTLAAHDFVQGFCAQQILLTRALKMDGAPTLPARWLQRLHVLAEAAKLTISPPPALQWVRGLEYAGLPQPVRRPEPRPPRTARPKNFTVSDIETWIRDPYALYAKKILHVRALEPLEQSFDSAQRGILLHHILKTFIDTYPDQLPAETVIRLHETAYNCLSESAYEQEEYDFWIRHFARIATDLAKYETDWRVSYIPFATELPGKISFGTDRSEITLTARADRLDSARDRRANSYVLIDYKSGGKYSAKGLCNGEHPQLALEGLILKSGGFGGNLRLDTDVYPRLSLLSFASGTLTRTFLDPSKSQHAITAASEGLRGLVDMFDDEQTPYLSSPDPAHSLRYSDYNHLARLAEWGVAEESEDDTGGESSDAGGGA
ncbi:MAG: double-strand break repair protein AddB [Alphaproteobacteria bacterium]|nr:double-strand break repair protein AddB [Alphaproteobacteria bacterium]